MTRPAMFTQQRRAGLFLDDGDVRLFHGDALETLRGLPDGCVDMVATSPPFYGLRDYGTGAWDGGDPGCDHRPRAAPRSDRPASGLTGGKATVDAATIQRGDCHCGARRVDRQIGLEETPDQWVDNLVAVFRECRRVLADHGTLWVEIGDSYNTTASGAGGESSSTLAGTPNALNPHSTRRTKQLVAALKPKDLLGQPWMLAFALRADGWYLRSEIIWARPNPMPESVTDRPTKAHSTVFLLSKNARYFFDADAIREAFASTNGSGNIVAKPNPAAVLGGGDTRHGIPWSPPASAPQVETLDGSAGELPRGPDGRRATQVKGQDGSEQHRDGERWPNPSGANARSVWTIPTEPTPFAHFATWPRKLVARMIQAGTSERGKCPECGKPWVREVERDAPPENATPGYTPAFQTRRFASATPGHITGSRTLGWSPSCAATCSNTGSLGPYTSVPCIVLDPFAGSGTTLLVARQHGRHAIGIELNSDYLKIAADRLSQLSLLTGVTDD